MALNATVSSILDDSLAYNSKRMYGRAKQVFETFHRAMFGRVGSLPITPNEVAMFVSYMDKTGHARTTIQTYVSALSHAHKIADLGGSTAKFGVKKVVDVAGSQAKAPSARRPITIKILDRIISAHLEAKEVRFHLQQCLEMAGETPQAYPHTASA